MTQAKSVNFVPVCRAADVAEGCAKRVLVGDLAVAIVHTAGEYFAIEDVCSHEEVPLSEGEIEDTTIECWLHGSRFDLVTGRPTGLPATKAVPVYEVKINVDQVMIALEEN